MIYYYGNYKWIKLIKRVYYLLKWIIIDNLLIYFNIIVFIF